MCGGTERIPQANILVFQIFPFIFLYTLGVTPYILLNSLYSCEGLENFNSYAILEILSSVLRSICAALRRQKVMP